MRRYRYTTSYPGNYNPNKQKDHQSPVPSQNDAMLAPYYPEYPGDLIPPQQANRSLGNLAVVRSHFDSRPINAFDFTFVDRFFGAAYYGGFAIPPGYVGILRSVTVEAFGNLGANPAFVDAYGFVEYNAHSLQILVNGAAQVPFAVPVSANSPNLNPGLNQALAVAGVFVDKLFTGGEKINTFVVLPEGSTCNIRIPNVTDTAGLFVSVVYQGNLLLSDGRQPISQVGNGDPEPVTVS